MRPARSSSESAAIAVVIGFLSLSGYSAVGAQDDLPGFMDTPLEINAALVVPDELMAGRSYSVQSVATSDGFNNTYIVEHEFGNIEAISDYHLRRVIQEIEALDTLEDMSRAGVFGDAMKEGVMGPIRGASALVKAPVETTKGAVKGMGRWVKNVGRGARSNDPYQEGAISSATGWQGTKRAFALELGVDPWTQWEPLQKGLSSVARAAFAGGITGGVIMDELAGDGTFGLVVGIAGMTDELNAILADNPAELVSEINTERLEGIGLPTSLVKPFILNYNYTPMEKSLLVQSVLQMENAKGRDLIIGYAAAAPDRVMARYRQQQAEMMANFYQDDEQFDIVEAESALWLKTRSGRLIGMHPVDYLAWIAPVRAVAEVGVAKDAKSHEIWLEGSASPLAREGLTAIGWDVKDRVGLITGEELQNAGTGRRFASQNRVLEARATEPRFEAGRNSGFRMGSDRLKPSN